MKPPQAILDLIAAQPQEIAAQLIPVQPAWMLGCWTIGLRDDPEETLEAVRTETSPIALRLDAEGDWLEGKPQCDGSETTWMVGRLTIGLPAAIKDRIIPH